jgi:hypothetical protein
MGKTATLANIGSVADSSLGFRNRIINGAMVIAQRATTATANSTTAASGLFIADRFRAVITAGTGVFTFAQDSSLYPTGFTYSLKSTVTTAYTVTGTDRYEIAQLIEGYNIADLSWGTASAQTITVSFWVRSSLTGTFGGVVQNANADYNYPFSYTVSVANTWEQKTITITGPTTGTWATDNTQGLKVVWSLGCGSTRLGTAGAWSATRFEGATGQTQLIATNGATFNITGVQLEKGATATSFDYRPYGTELSLCQRYLPAYTGGVEMLGYWDSTNEAKIVAPFLVEARVAPTGVTSSGSFNVHAPGVGNPATTAIAFSRSTTTSCRMDCSVASGGLTSGLGAGLNSAAGKILFTGCEL